MKSILLIACGAIAKEIVSLQKLSSWQHMDIQCLPANLHNNPEKIPQAVRNKLVANQGEYQKMYVAYGDCGTGGLLDKVLDEFGVARLPGAHCYEFFSGKVFHELHEEEPGTFYLTDFLVRHFQRLVIEGLGINKHPQLLKEYFKHYKKVVYLAQTHSQRLQQEARICADQLNLDYQYCYTGLKPLAEDLGRGIEEVVKWQK